MQEAIDLICQLVHERFFGALTLKFEAGKVVYFKKEQTLKPSDLSRQSKERECKDNKH